MPVKHCMARSYGSKPTKAKTYGEHEIMAAGRSFTPPKGGTPVKARKKGSIYGGKNRRASWA